MTGPRITTGGPAVGPLTGTTASVGEPAGRDGVDAASSSSARGRTTIADAVVSAIAARAARDVPGVHGFGGGAARPFGAVTERIPGSRSSTTRGVSVEVGEREAAVDLTVVVDYGVSVPDLARSVRRTVIAAIEQMTGLVVVEVNISVDDLNRPGDDEGGAHVQTPDRAQPPATGRVR
jgi:uncharacterized alkaline shock family protein YloU